MKHARIFLALAAVTILSTPACDTPEADQADECQQLDGYDDTVVARPELHLAAPEGAPAPLEISFREQGPPKAKYIQTISDEKISAKHFAAAVTACADVGDPDWLLTLSWYQPDTSKPERVLGLGGSIMAPYPLFDCFSKFFDSNGAVPLP